MKPNPYLPGYGDATPEPDNGPTCEQIQRAVKEHALAVAKNALDGDTGDLITALMVLAMYDDCDALRVVLGESARDLLERGMI